MSAVSIRTQLLQLAGMVDTTGLNAWENTFLKSVLAQSEEAARTSRLSEKQLERIEELWRKHFAG